jgi:hypothetical protein
MMRPRRAEQRIGTSDVHTAVTGASIGNAVEWFDFAIYGFLATIIAANFLPSAYYVVAAAVASLLTILTIRETAGRPLSHGISDQTFQSAELK